MKDGWHTVKGYYVLVEDGKILRGILNGTAVYPFRRNKRYGGYDKGVGVKVSTFRRSNLYIMS